MYGRATETGLAPVVGSWRPHLLMLALVLTTGAASALFGERIPLFFGVGFDSFYSTVIIGLPRHVFVEGLDPYRLQRVFPSVLVRYGLLAVGAPLDTANTVRGFVVLDLIMLMITCALWKPVADALGLSVRGRWLGFLALFVNYAVLKHAFYHPVYTDVTAYALGMASLHAFLHRRQWLLLAVAVLGAFTWPVVGASAFFLLLWPYTAAPEPRGDTRWGALAAVGLAAALLGAFAYMYLVRHIRKVGFGPTVPIVESVALLSMACYAFHLLFGFGFLLRGIDPGWVGRALQAIRPRNLLFALLPTIVVNLAVLLLPQQPEGTLDTRGFGRYLIFLPNTRPWLQLVSHVAWWGPAVLLMVLVWPRMSRWAQRMGPGMLGFVLFGFVIALTPESRQSTYAFPAFAALLARASDDLRWSRVPYWFVAATGVALSKFWLRINEWGDVYGRVARDEGTMYRWYYVSDGPWMPNDSYVVHAGVVLVLGAALYWLLVRERARRVVRTVALPESVPPALGSTA